MNRDLLVSFLLVLSFSRRCLGVAVGCLRRGCSTLHQTHRNQRQILGTTRRARRGSFQRGALGGSWGVPAALGSPLGLISQVSRTLQDKEATDNQREAPQGPKASAGKIPKSVENGLWRPPPLFLLALNLNPISSNSDLVANQNLTKPPENKHFLQKLLENHMEPNESSGVCSNS